MKPRFIIVAFLLFAAGNAGVLGDIDSALAEKMALNPDAQFHVIAFFRDRLTPEQVIVDHGIQGDELKVLGEVVEIYKNRARDQFFWLTEFCEQKEEMEGLCLYEHLQAVSFKAVPKVITQIAQREEIERVALFTTENTMPDPFFLKRPYFTIEKANIALIGEGSGQEVAYIPEALSREEGIDPEIIINILKKIFDFIKENQPVVNTSVDQASAVPQGITHWQQLAGWQEKHTGQYVIEYVNGFGITVVKIVFRVHFYHHGNYNGIGRYITCATASIDQLTVLWGYTLNAEVKIPDSGIVNIGTHTAPIAGMKMFVHWAVHTIIQHEEGTMTFSLDGNGNITSY